MHLLTILLEIDSTASALLKSLTDQALSLGILGLISSMLWRKMNRMEDDMKRYQDIDRKEMRDVLNENTRVLDRNSGVMEKLEQILKDKQ